MFQLKKILRYVKEQIKKRLIKTIHFLPVSSKYIGSPKSYYASSKNYWETYKLRNLSGFTYATFLPSSMSQRSSPKSIAAKKHWKFDNRHLHPNPETFVISIPKGRAVGNAGTVITHDDKLLLDVSLQFGVTNDLSSIKSHRAFNYLKLPQCKQTPQTIALLAVPSGDGYFHWLTDALPRLEILKKTLPDGLESIDKLLVNKGISVIAESLEILGISKDKLLFSDSNTHIQAESLIVPSLPGTTGDPPSWVCTFLRENFLQHKANIVSPTRLYISRSKARYRRVTNEESMLECLSKFGFQTVWLEEHNFATQIALLSNAEVIVAPHGAGLSNLVWCSYGAKVLEIFSPNYVNVCFWAIANQIGLEYFYLIGDGKRPIDCFDSHLVEDDIFVSIEELTLSLELLLK